MEGGQDPGGAILTRTLGQNPLGGSIFEEQNIHADDTQWTEDHQRILERENSHGSVDVLDAEDLPTFYAALRLLPIAIMLPAAGGIGVSIQAEFVKILVCEVSYNISANICAHIGDAEYKSLGDKVVADAAHYQLFSTLVGSLIPVVLSLFVGSWSDKFGRKWPMMIPFLGYFFGNLFVSVISNFRLHPAFMLIPPFLGSLTGGWTILLMAMFSYIGDYTTDKTRAMNIAVIDGLMILVGNVAGLLGGFLFKLYGFQVPIYVQTSMHGLSFLYVLVVIRDRISRPKGESRSCAELFSFSHLRDNLQMLRTQRLGSTRTHIYLVLFSLFLFSICDSGEENITQYFVEFQPFNWTVTFYTIYSCISGVCRSLAIIIGMVAFRKFLHINDTLIAFIGAFSGVLYFFGFGIARTSSMLYIAATAGMLRTMMIVCTRSILSALVESYELGKMMSMISSLQALTPLIGASIFNSIFAATSSWFSGMCFLVGAFLTVFVMAAFGYVDVERRQALYSTPRSPKSFLG
ncbi:putative Proton-coupled folate transporter [Hypsibius exemplaris]|uniref:Proton-coupled folate transporter n=1 Tax=Hypsibius exemplaris TaxID=2072580 RepID=A0A1W0WGM4_HYPEX|nr:putative Proton-coupled folate transporter [Hypsibius exemplaris]